MNTVAGAIRTRAGENYLTEEEEKKLFKFLRDRKDWQAVRDYVLLRLGRATGLRREELANLNVGDVYGKERLEVNERVAVKGAVGTVDIPVEIQKLLSDFFRQKHAWGESLADDAPLFVSKKGGRLDVSTVNRLMDKWCRLAGIPHYSPHALRHTKAQRIMADIRHLNPEEQDKKLRFVNQQLRHKSWGATMIYTRPTKEQMARVGAI